MYAISIIFSISHVTLLVLSQYSLQNHKHSYSCVAKNLNLIFFKHNPLPPPYSPPKKEKKIQQLPCWYQATHTPKIPLFSHQGCD